MWGTDMSDEHEAIPYGRVPGTDRVERDVDVEILIGRLHMQHLVIGHDHGFGRGRSGDVETLRDVGRELGFGVTVVEASQTDTLLYDVVIGRNVFTRLVDKLTAAQTIKGLLRPGGRLALAEIVPRHTQRLHRLVDLSGLDEILAGRVVAAEEAIYANPDDPMVNWEAVDLQRMLAEAGFENLDIKTETSTSERRIGLEQIQRWFTGETTAPHSTPSAGQARITLAQHLARQGVTPAELTNLKCIFEQQLREQVVSWHSTIAYVVAC